MSVRRLLREFDSAELTEWQGFDLIEPLGAMRVCDGVDPERLATADAPAPDVPGKLNAILGRMK